MAKFPDTSKWELSWQFNRAQFEDKVHEVIGVITLLALGMALSLLNPSNAQMVDGQRAANRA
jgi:hypothetical protein